MVHVQCEGSVISNTPEDPGVKSRMYPPYPNACRKRRLKWDDFSELRKRLTPCRCLDGNVKEPYEMFMALILGARPTVGQTSSSVRLHIYVPSHI